MSSPCNICLEETCGGKHDCHCETCELRPKCFRHLHATIRITNKCTQECAHCCFESSPKSNIMMSFETAQDIAKFVKSNDVMYLNLMGGEFFCNPDWYRIFRVLIEATKFTRIVSNGDWANVNSVKTKLMKLKDEFEGKFKISISHDKWHTNENVEKAEEFLKEKNFLYNIGSNEDMSDLAIVPTGRSMFAMSTYSMFSCYCHNPEHKYGFLIDEDGEIYKCDFGNFGYANIHDYLDGGFDVRFKEFNKRFYDVFIPSCTTCVRYCMFTKREESEYKLIIEKSNMENEIYDIVKNIPLKSGGYIQAGGKLQKAHGVYYLDGMMLPPDYQKDFSGLVYAEKMTGWNYLVPLKSKTAYQNSKEDK